MKENVHDDNFLLFLPLSFIYSSSVLSPKEGARIRRLEIINIIHKLSMVN